MDKILKLKNLVENTLEDTKAIDIVSSRHIQSLAEAVLEKFKNEKILNCQIEGKNSNDWKLIDGIDVIVHIFNHEKRKFYDLEKMWSEFLPKERILI